MSPSSYVQSPDSWRWENSSHGKDPDPGHHSNFGSESVADPSSEDLGGEVAVEKWSQDPVPEVFVEVEFAARCVWLLKEIMVRKLWFPGAIDLVVRTQPALKEGGVAKMRVGGGVFWLMGECALNKIPWKIKFSFQMPEIIKTFDGYQ